MNKHQQSKNNSLRLSQMLPIIGKSTELKQKGLLIPGVLLILLTIGLLVLKGNNFNLLLAVYILGGSCYFIYRLTGKSKPWLVLLSSFLITCITVSSPIKNLFFTIIPDIVPKEVWFLHHLFGTGPREELWKAVPVFLALIIGRKLRSPWREQIGVWEPLDGIILATTSATGFTFVETMGQYVPNVISSTGELAGLQLLLPRLIGEIGGHVAYSGCFGYFIGLSVLKSSKRWQILAIGYLIASTLHALWDSICDLPDIIAIPLLFCTGVLSYLFLIAAILKARQLSPTRAQNWATQYHNPLAPPALALSPPALQASLFLSIQQRSIPLNVGTQLHVDEVPGLGAQSRGIVAEVSAHPQDPNILGLKNCSDRVWIVTLADGQQPRIDPGRNIKLVPGIKINFGVVIGEIRS